MRTVVAILFLLNVYCTNCGPCNLRHIGWKRYVCVCNTTYCDTIPKVEKVEKGKYNLFVSDVKGKRVEKVEGEFEKEKYDPFVSKISVNKKETHQSIIGFGGAFTDSAGVNIGSLPKSLQNTLLRSLFSEDGSEYSLGRVPIGGSDFSLRPYTYQDDENGSFALQQEDFHYKIPYILQAMKMSNVPLKLVASVWSAPAWAKTNDKVNHGGFLKHNLYQWWADYFIKFFDGYEKQGIKFWAVTTQNEPGTGLVKAPINTMSWFPFQLRKWVANNLGPTLRNSSYSDLKLLIHDDQRATIIFAQEYFADPDALKYIDGVAVHWYLNSLVPPVALQLAKTGKKDVFLISTEACTGSKPFTKPVILGSWPRAEMYAKYMIQDLQDDSIGWIDWNLALDLKGGPLWIKNQVDASIIVNAKKQEFYKQPQYYSLLHFSKFIPRGSKRITSSVGLVSTVFLDRIKSAAFLRPDGGVAMVILNMGGKRTIKVYDEERGSALLKLTPHSINTLVYY